MYLISSLELDQGFCAKCIDKSNGKSDDAESENESVEMDDQNSMSPMQNDRINWELQRSVAKLLTVGGGWGTSNALKRQFIFCIFM